MTGSSKLICVGAIAGAFGIKGEVKLKSFTDVPQDCAKYGPLSDQSGKIILTPAKHRLVKNFVAVTAPEIKTREEAEALKSTSSTFRAACCQNLMKMSFILQI